MLGSVYGGGGDEMKKQPGEPPRIEQVVVYIEQRLADGTWGTGRIPTVADLERELGFSSVTIRSAIQRLVGSGLLEKRGNSWVVSDQE
jgi:DNA-binding GntR family transcriptional regulator